MGLDRMEARDNNTLFIIHQKYSEPPDELCTTFCKLTCNFMLALEEAYDAGIVKRTELELKNNKLERLRWESHGDH